MLRKFLIFAGVLTVSSSLQAQTPVEIAAERLEPYRNLPEFIEAGPAFNARECMKDKKIISIPVSSANPHTKNINNAMKEVADKVGFEFMEWQNQGRTTQWVQGVDFAIDNGFDLIDLLGGTDPRVLGPQIQRAQEAGITVVASHYSGLEQEVANDVEAVGLDYRRAGQLLADWVILNTDGEANTLILVSNEVFSTESMLNGIKDEFEELCPDCTYRVQNVPISEWSSKIQSTVQSELLRDSSINYIIPIYDAMSQFVVPAITITGKQDSVKVATFNGNPFVIEFIQQGQVEMDIGENLDWASHAIIDAEMRMLCGLDKIEDPKIPLYIFDKDNAHTAGTPPQLSVGYGDAYLEGYNKLWMLE